MLRTAAGWGWGLVAATNLPIIWYLDYQHQIPYQYLTVFNLIWFTARHGIACSYLLSTSLPTPHLASCGCSRKIRAWLAVIPGIGCTDKTYCTEHWCMLRMYQWLSDEIGRGCILISIWYWYRAGWGRPPAPHTRHWGTLTLFWTQDRNRGLLYHTFETNLSCKILLCWCLPRAYTKVGCHHPPGRLILLN